VTVVLLFVFVDVVTVVEVNVLETVVFVAPVFCDGDG
jgi:hypothetical protein